MKHVEQFPVINKSCNVASCWIYLYIGTLLGARPILHISRIRVNRSGDLINGKVKVMGLIKLHTMSCEGVEVESRDFLIRVLNVCVRLGSHYGLLICNNISPDSY
jgi:hypothetical protein